MSGKCANLFLLLCASVCFENVVVPLEFEDSAKEKSLLDNKVIIIPGFEENSIEELHDVEGSEEHFNQSDEIFQSQMDGTFHKTVKRYHCKVSGLGSILDNESTLLIHGTKSWSFPRQDVNLTLFYPMDNVDHDSDYTYLITRFEVVLFIDGSKTRGFINYGGLMEDSIGLSFVINNITMLGYQFQLHGVRNTRLFTDLPSHTIRLCD